MDPVYLRIIKDVICLMVFMLILSNVCKRLVGNVKEGRDLVYVDKSSDLAKILVLCILAFVMSYLFRIICLAVMIPYLIKKYNCIQRLASGLYKDDWKKQSGYITQISGQINKIWVIVVLAALVVGFDILISLIKGTFVLY